jgi:hypothetical protein
VDNGAPRSAYDWALYFCEYGAFMSPLSPAAAVLPSGINVAYPRSALELTRAIWEAAFHENEVHDALRGAGVRFGLVPEARVWSHLGFGFGAAMAHLFAGGRRFAAHRAARERLPGRMFWTLAAAAVPALLLARMARRIVGRRPGRLVHLLCGLPWVLGLLVAWSAGEMIGPLAPVPEV